MNIDINGLAAENASLRAEVERTKADLAMSEREEMLLDGANSSLRAEVERLNADAIKADAMYQRECEKNEELVAEVERLRGLLVEAHRSLDATGDRGVWDLMRRITNALEWKP